jgi:hypothetical protein
MKMQDLQHWQSSEGDEYISSAMRFCQPTLAVFAVEIDVAVAAVHTKKKEIEKREIVLMQKPVTQQLAGMQTLNRLKCTTLPRGLPPRANGLPALRSR